MSRAFSSLAVNFCKRSVRFPYATTGTPWVACWLQKSIGFVRLFLFAIEIVNDVEHHEALHTVIPVVAGVFGTGPGVGTAALVVSVSAMLVSIHQKNIAQAFILERYFFVSIYPAVIPGTYLMVFLVVALLLCL